MIIIFDKTQFVGTCNTSCGRDKKSKWNCQSSSTTRFQDKQGEIHQSPTPRCQDQDQG